MRLLRLVFVSGAPDPYDTALAFGCVNAALGAAFVAMPGHKGLLGPQAVSYTHLDVYKRQVQALPGLRVRYAPDQ